MLDLDIVLVCAWFIGNALIGGIAYVSLHPHKKRSKVLRHLILSLIAGYMYFIAYRQYQLPDGFVAFPIGWFAPDVIESLMNKFKPKTKE